MEKKNEKIYTRQEAKTATLEYFNGDELAADVWINKYCLKDSEGNLYEKSPDDMHTRIANELHRIEKKYPNPRNFDEIFDSLKHFKRIVPQGSPMAGIGNNKQFVSLSNCFVIGNLEDSDSYGGIFKVDQEIAQLQKRRAGVGTDLSYIRPKGTPVKNSAITSTGIVPFMERHSNTTKEVAQDGRRGALMLTVSINHPDAEDFIDAKLESGRVTGANISVKISDEFMKAVQNDEPFIQHYPAEREKINPEIIKEYNEKIKNEDFTYNELYSVGNKQYIKIIDSNKLWKKIIHNAWKSAEPGLLFWSTILNESIPDCYSDLGFKTICVNPCITGDSWIMTNNGPKQVKDLIGVDFTALVDGKPYKSNGGFFYTGNKTVYEIETNKGFKIKATGEHKLKKAIKYNRNKKELKWVKLKDLNVGDYLNLNNHKNIEFSSSISNYNGEDRSVGWLIGSLVGDGSLVGERAFLRYWGDNRKNMRNLVIETIKKSITYGPTFGSGNGDDEIITITSNTLGKIANELSLHDGKNLGVNIEKQSSDFYCGFISGLFDADGTVLDNTKKGISVRLSSSKLNNLEVIQRMLLRLGIVSSVVKNRRNERVSLLPDGKGGLKEYQVKSQHELIISKENILIFNDRIGFKEEPKQKKLNAALSKLEKRGLYKEYFMDKIKSIKPIGFEDVYDCTIEDVHEFDCNGISTHNCGEITLSESDSCRLLSLNLYGYVENPFKENARFNYELFEKDAQLGQRFMDDIIDLEIEKIDSIINKIDADPESDLIKMYEKNLWERIKEAAINGRRTGLGVTGEGDMLAALGYTYGTDEANEFAENIHRKLKLNAYRSSVEMAKERGTFPIFDAKREKNNPFLLRIKSEDEKLYNDIMKYGRRNISLLTIAPTGSTSILTQTTSGIECVFLPYYMRRRKINTQEKNTRVDFIDAEGIKWTEYPVFHHNFKTWLEVNGFDVDVVRTMKNTQINEIIKMSPYHQATSNDVDWVKKVEMQGMVQRHVDHSISVTVNLPKDITEDMVSQVYEKGWSMNCKGITVYRDGSREGVLISSSKDKSDEFKENDAPRRPKRLKGEIHRFQNNLEKWIAVIGLLDGKPYELFTGKNENGTIDIPGNIKYCDVVKNIYYDVNGKRKKSYDIEYIDASGEKHTVKRINRAFDPEYWNYGKFISGVMRHGMKPIHIFKLVETLNLKDDNLNTWKNGVARAMKKYISDGEKYMGTCEDCGGNNLEFRDKCPVCLDCGSSKCG